MQHTAVDIRSVEFCTIKTLIVYLPPLSSNKLSRSFLLKHPVLCLCCLFLLFLVSFLLKKPCALAVFYTIYFSFIITNFKQKKHRVLVNALCSAPL